MEELQNHGVQSGILRFDVLHPFRIDFPAERIILHIIRGPGRGRLPEFYGPAFPDLMTFGEQSLDRQIKPVTLFRTDLHRLQSFSLI